MEAIKSKTLYKLMWLPDKNEIIWKLQKEELASPLEKDIILNSLEQMINIFEWHKKYSILYHKWLNDDSPFLYDINNPVHKKMINAIKLANQKLSKNNILLFYWFDLDRSINEEWEWEKDPLSQKTLFTLDSSYNKLNRKISLTNFLVFPIYKNQS